MAVPFLLSPLLASTFEEDLGKLYAQGQFRQADGFLRERIARDPTDQELWLQLAELRKSIGDDAGALTAYRSCLEKGGDAKVRLALGLTLLQMGRSRNAEAFLLEARKQEPRDPWVLWGLAQVDHEKARVDKRRWFRKRELEEAAGFLNDLVKIKPRFAPAYWRLGEVLTLAGDDQGALDAYLALLKLDPSYKKVHGLIARLLERLGRSKEALERYQRAMQVEPQNQELKAEAALVAKELPGEEKKRKALRLAQWKDYQPTPAPPIAPSPVTVRVGLLTGMGRVVFRGQGDLTVSVEGQGPVTQLQGGVDHQWIYRRGRKGQADAWELLDRRNKLVLKFDRPLQVSSPDPAKAILIHALPSGAGYFFAKEAEDRAYRGTIEVRPEPGKGFSVIDRVGLEDYCAGVIPSEMNPSWPMEALKAQAVAARSYAMTRMGGHASQGFDVVDTVGDQVYRGITAEVARSSEAVRQTAGMVVKKGDHILKTVFSAECGGHTQDYQEAWGGHEPVVGVPDFPERYNRDMEFPPSPLHLKEWVQEDRVAWCRVLELRGYKNYRWISMIGAQELEAKAPEIGRLKRLLVEKRSSAGWAQVLLVEGDQGTKRVRGDAIRGFLGGLRSNLVWIETQRDPKGWPLEYTIYGGGWGHGVGLCQVGCYGLARAGEDFRAILRHYFPKGSVEKLGP
ncbi:MAG TPA: SpoIID/LytB domain-containing protein [bacterium]|nr:SpoIID/LytB domain-containing protein [bacterium]